MEQVKLRPDILALLLEAGFSTYRIRKEKRLSESTLQRIRNGEQITLGSCAAICNMLGHTDIFVYNTNDRRDGKR